MHSTEALYALLFMRLIFHKVVIERIFMILFSQIASGSSYKKLKLWEIHNFIFTKVSKICEICCPINKRADMVLHRTSPVVC